MCLSWVNNCKPHVEIGFIILYDYYNNLILVHETDNDTYK